VPASHARSSTMTIATDPQLDSPDTFVDGVPHDVFRRLRQEAPVYWQRLPDGSGFWAVTKYEDLTHMSQHPAIFSSARGTNIEDAQGGVELMMVNMDAPRHTKLRLIVNHEDSFSVMFHPATPLWIWRGGKRAPWSPSREDSGSRVCPHAPARSDWPEPVPARFPEIW